MSVNLAYKSLLLLSSIFLALGPAHGAGWAKVSDIGRAALVGTALVVPAVQGDWRGDLQAGGSILLAHGMTTGLKEIFPERRPDGGSKSFPSKHSSDAFAAAATLENRYGWKAGLPAFVVATLVGVGRVEARRHHWYDVVAGAAIGTGSGLLLTSRRNDRVRLVPWGDSGGGGLSLALRF